MKTYLETFKQTVKDAQESPDGYAVMVIEPPKREAERTLKLVPQPLTDSLRHLHELKAND